MAIDPDIHTFLNQLKQNGFPDITTLSAEKARLAVDHSALSPKPIRNNPDIDISNIVIKQDNRQIPLRIYKPKENAAPFPVLVFMHGGGFVLGTLDDYDGFCIQIAKAANCMVLSVQYRLAPEFPFPIPVEDCYQATRWIADNAKLLCIAPDKIFVGGDSAGGDLAAAVALMARDQNYPRIEGQILLYPATDTNFHTASYQTQNTINLNREMMQWYWQHYLPNKADWNNPYAAPLKASSVDHLPQALVITNECDPLHDEGLAYAERLKAAHLLYDYHCYAGMVHAFPFYANAVASAKKATEDMIARIAEMIKTV
ncbi:MAG: alpha/beta hydrolase [Gammaproteobacteria bacterium]|nr:alpha/beta hydrolase [Gammaproteobacteria bacterium]